MIGPSFNLSAGDDPRRLGFDVVDEATSPSSVNFFEKALSYQPSSTLEMLDWLAADHQPVLRSLTFQVGVYSARKFRLCRCKNEVL